MSQYVTNNAPKGAIGRILARICTGGRSGKFRSSKSKKKFKV